MDIALPFSPRILTGVLLVSYILAMWWLLRKESWKTLLAVLVVSVVGFLLRMWDVEELPPGLNDDEIKTFGFTKEVLEQRRVFRPGLYVSMLWTALFYEPYYQVSGSIFWTMRMVPILFGTASIPVAFALSRALSFNVVPALVVASLTAAMPWAVFWSRQQWGGDIVFFQALLLASLARIIWQKGGKVEIFIGVLGLVGILYDYTAGWPMVGMPFLAVLLAPNNQQRVRSIFVLLFSVILWIPWIFRSDAWLHFVTARSIGHGSSISTFLSTFKDATLITLRTFVYPEGTIYWTSLQGVAMHPVAVLVAAGLGVLCCLWKRGLFLLLGFFAGILPAILSVSGTASGHRMMAAYLFISVAAGGFFEFLISRATHARYRTMIVALSALFALVTGAQGMQIFFSPDFWARSDSVFWYGATKLSESIKTPVKEPLIVDFEVGRLLTARGDNKPGFSTLGYENWMPIAPIEYAFMQPLSSLLPLYRGALPSSQVTEYGTGPTMAFTARFTTADVQQWRQFGWSTEVFCGEKSIVKTQLPALMYGASFSYTWWCQEPRRIVYKGTWQGAPTDLTFFFIGASGVSVKGVSGLSVDRSPSSAQFLNFRVSQGEQLTVSAQIEHGLTIKLLKGKDGVGELVPLKEVRPSMAP